MFEQLGLIGCGLMGGSFALALKRAKLVKRVVGYSRSPSTTERARQLGVIDGTATSALQAVAGADLVLIAVPVGASEPTFKEIRESVTDSMLVMDVGSTKRDVVGAAQRGLGDRLGSFVPVHPMTGKEVAGVEHADARLYAGQRIVITPIPATRPSHIERATRVWTGIGGKVTAMTPEAHDTALAAISHLPHLIAFAFMDAIAGQPEGGRFLELAGPGFRDFTRIAGGDPAVWRDIFVANREQVLFQSQAFREALRRFEALVVSGDAQALEGAIAAVSPIRARWQPGTSN
jgi:prephenate dehydrogenase